MTGTWWSGVAVGAGVLVALELLFVLLLRRLAGFRLRALYHLWAASVATVAAVEVTTGAPLATLPRRLAATAALLLTALVLFALVEALILRRAWGRDRPSMPKLARDVLRLAVLVAVGLFAVTAILGQPLNAVLVSSTVLSAVVGLALQDTLKNVFAGMALDIEKPFQRGDFLLLDGTTQVQVLDMSWRSARLLTKEGVEIHEPNANLSVSRIVNYGSGARPAAIPLEVGLPYGVPPNEAKTALLEAARSVPGTADSPETRVFLDRFDDHAVVYRLRVWTWKVGDLASFRSDVNTRIWYELKRRGLAVPFPIRTLHLHRAADDAARSERKAERKARELLARVGLFDGLGPEVVDRLAAAATRRLYDAGEVLVREGDAGDSLFVLERGAVRVLKADEAGRGEPVEVSRLGPGDFFGEASLLTGEPRGATVVAAEACSALELAKSALAPILAESPELAATLGDALAGRRAATDTAVAERRARRDPSLDVAEDRESLLRRIRTFFSL